MRIRQSAKPRTLGRLIRQAPPPPPILELGLVVIFVPLKLVGKNARDGHWGARSRRAKEHRDAVALALHTALGRKWRLRASPSTPKLVHFEIWRQRLLDDDALPYACQHVRDGLQGLLIHHDGPTSGHRFSYSQVLRQPAGVQVRVELLTRTPNPPSLPA